MCNVLQCGYRRPVSKTITKPDVTVSKSPVTDHHAPTVRPVAAAAVVAAPSPAAAAAPPVVPTVQVGNPHGVIGIAPPTSGCVTNLGPDPTFLDVVSCQTQVAWFAGGTPQPVIASFEVTIAGPNTSIDTGTVFTTGACAGFPPYFAECEWVAPQLPPGDYTATVQVTTDAGVSSAVVASKFEVPAELRS